VLEFFWLLTLWAILRRGERLHCGRGVVEKEEGAAETSKLCV